mmetsp:Transcript_6095/g.7235  ORF Transcript_6095/g.7235 Transcript_6095/m.7235 type:complete len:352 (+) Transcript_6095:282-1337(+)
MWTMFANTLGMSFVLPLKIIWAYFAGERLPRYNIRPWRLILSSALLDASSAAILTLALLRSGASAFSVAYSSCAMLVAVLGWMLGLRKKKLICQQWFALVLATSGLILYSSTRKNDISASDTLFDVGLALVGSIGHSAMFVLAEYVTTAESAAGVLSPFELSSYMGLLQCLALYILGFILDSQKSFRPSIYEPGLLSGYASLTLIDALHALAFFTTLGDLGAVHAAMLKGIQVVLVFTITKLTTCLYASSQAFSCILTRFFSWQALAVLLVVLSLQLFYGIHSDLPPANPIRSVGGLIKAKHSDPAFESTFPSNDNYKVNGDYSPLQCRGLPSSSSSAEHLLHDSRSNSTT